MILLLFPLAVLASALCVRPSEALIVGLVLLLLVCAHALSVSVMDLVVVR